MLKDFFRRVECFKRVKAVLAMIVGAFVNNDVQKNFPSVQGRLAIWTKIFSFERSFKTIIGLEDSRADFAKQLQSSFAVVVVQVLMRCIAVRALLGLRDGFSVLDLNGLKWTPVFGLIGLKQRPVI